MLVVHSGDMLVTSDIDGFLGFAPEKYLKPRQIRKFMGFKV
jgi:hypothetical protein